MADIPVQILKVARPIHWIKNLALFAPLVFEGAFFNPGKFWLVVIGFFIF